MPWPYSRCWVQTISQGRLAEGCVPCELPQEALRVEVQLRILDGESPSAAAEPSPMLLAETRQAGGHPLLLAEEGLELRELLHAAEKTLAQSNETLLLRRRELAVLAHLQLPAALLVGSMPDRRQWPRPRGRRRAEVLGAQGSAAPLRKGL